MGLLGIRKASLLYRPPIEAVSSFLVSSMFDGTSGSSIGSELGGWWDFSDAAYLDQGVADATGVPGVGDRVGHCDNQITRLNDMVAAADNNTRPVFLSGGGIQLLVAENRKMFANVGGTVTGTDMYVAIVTDPTGSANGARVVYFSNGTTTDWNNAGRAAALNWRTGSVAGTYRNADLCIDGPFPDGMNLMEVLFDGANNTIWGNTTSGTPVASTAAFNFADLGIGCAAANTNPYAGKIYEVIAINREPDVDEIAGLRGYLNAKYSIY